MLSFKKFKNSLPIAKIQGGKNNGKIIYLSDESNERDIPVDSMEILDEIMKEKNGRLRFDKMSRLQRSIKYNIEPLDEDILQYYNQTMSKIDHYSKKDFKIHDGELIPIPNIKQRECIYVAGPSGSGKSTYISNYAQEFQHIFPDKTVFVFSRLNEDEPIDILDPYRIEINQELIDEPINPDELSDSLVIFDDTDTIPDKKLNEAVRKLKNDLLETGRHNDVYVVISSHLMTNYKDTRTILNECHSITFFPSAGSSHQITYCLKTYFGLNKDQINKIMRLPSRWVSIYKNYPQRVLYSKGIYLLSK
jgi:hypothetical protein